MVQLTNKTYVESCRQEVGSGKPFFLPACITNIMCGAEQSPCDAGGLALDEGAHAKGCQARGATGDLPRGAAA